MSESVNIMNENTKDKLEFPIYGSFTSKRKIRYSFCIYEDGTVAQWQRKRKDNGLKHVVQSNDYDIYCKAATKECIEYIVKYYGLDINFLH